MIPATTPARLLEQVCAALDILIDRGQRYGGLFPSLLDRDRHVMLTELPPGIPGQRNGDRAHRGSNLIHDEATLKTLYGLATALDRPAYAGAADACLQRFATHCTDTVTGLFPWGEHSFWNLEEDGVGNGSLYVNPAARGSAIHDHLRQAPVWLWEKLQAFNPRCVERFAEGLDYHWIEGAHEEYIRHAHIEQRTYHTRGARSCDFPRHGGFYILDWTCAYLHTGREDFLRQIHDMLDYWWEKRDDRGLLLIESRSPETDTRFHRVNAPGQTLSLGVSLLESAELLREREPVLAATMRERARVYLNGFLAAPHDLARDVFVILSHRDTGEVTEAMPVWGSVYGVWPASYVALAALLGYRFTGEMRLLAWAEAVGRAYAGQPLPADTAVPAMDAGLGLGLLADLFAVTGEDAWLYDGLRLAESLAAAYCDRPLPRGAAGIDWYESQMGPGFLLHGLARIALLARDGLDCPLEADYTAR